MIIKNKLGELISYIVNRNQRMFNSKLFLSLTISVLLLIILLTHLISASLNITSENYSGFLTSGVSPGNLTSTTLDGSTAGFFQAIGYLIDLLFTGIHGFSFNVSAPSGSPPTINITRPENETYIVRTSLPLNYTALNALYVWYNLDAIGSNTTLSGNTTFTTTNGLHTFYLWANNTYGNSSTNVTFTANTTKFIIYYSNYSGSTKGASNDFNSSNYEELQDLSDIILENTDYGKIKFNEAINLTNDSVPSDNELDLDTYTNISNNSIILNSTELPNFNKSATLYLYGLTFTNPRVLKDGEACPSTICTEVNYSGGIFVFNVTQFTNYSADETPTEEAPVTPPGGGGGGITITPTFTVDKDQISVSLTPGRVKTETITVTNTGTGVISVKIDNLFQDFVMKGEDIIILNPGESKVIPLLILARVDTIPDIYLGKIIISSENVKKEILISVEVESEGTLLDVRAEIAKDYKKVLPGENILAQIRLFNLGGGGRKDVGMEYIIKDYKGNEIAKETETLAIETQITFLKEIYIPEKTKTGNYVFYVRAIHDGKVASASDNFEVVSSKVTTREKIYIVTIIILSVILSLIIYYVMLKKDRKKKVEKINLRRIMR